MVTTTTLLCSKFSAQCVKVIDSLKKLNISLEPQVKLVWIDHPNVRNYLRGTQVKSVPCIIVYDEDRDISIVYEKERFTDYLNNFIQQRNQKSQTPHALSSNPAFMSQHNQFMSQQQHTLNTLQKSHADLAVHQVQTLGNLPSSHSIKTSLSRQMFGTDTPPPPPSSTGMKAMGQKMVDDLKQGYSDQKQSQRQNLAVQKEAAFKQTNLQNQLLQQQVQQSRQQQAEEYERKKQESDNLGLMGLMAELKKMPQYSALSDADLFTVSKEKTLSHDISKIEQAHQRLSDMRQLHAAEPEKVNELDKELTQLTQAKMMLAHQRLQLPQLSTQNQLKVVANPERPQLERDIEILQNQMKQDPTDESVKTALSGLLARQRGVENFINLQQEKLESDLSMTKKSQQKNGTTSIDSLLGGDDSLYDHHVKRKGTDFHQSEAQVNTALSSSKRNSINQKVREMSQTLPIKVDMGSGHENMLHSSLTVLPDKKQSFTPIDSVVDDPFGSFGSFGDDAIEQTEEDQQIVSSAVKKKSSALDVAREMEKGRGMIDKEYERRA